MVSSGAKQMENRDSFARKQKAHLGDGVVENKNRHHVNRTQ